MDVDAGINRAERRAARAVVKRMRPVAKRCGIALPRRADDVIRAINAAEIKRAARAAREAETRAEEARAVRYLEKHAKVLIPFLDSMGEIDDYGNRTVTDRWLSENLPMLQREVHTRRLTGPEPAMPKPPKPPPPKLDVIDNPHYAPDLFPELAADVPDLKAVSPNAKPPDPPLPEKGR